MATSAPLLAFLAGIVSLLSPCVLPLVPIVLGTAASQHRAGPAALAAGLALSFTAIGLFVATIGFSIGLDTDKFRTIAALLLIGFASVLAFPTLQTRLTDLLAPLTGGARKSLDTHIGTGLSGQFTLGLLLGAVWAPCVGPTLGAASVLAAQGQNLGMVFAVMAAFGLGAALPLLVLGWLSREALQRWRGRMMTSSLTLKRVMALVLAGIGVLILIGADKTLETWLVAISPEWLTTLTTRF